MFGINSLEQVGQIAEGFYNDITKKENELHDKRMAICKECPLYTVKPGLGPICDSKKCFDKKTNIIEYFPGNGRICGCSCLLDKKTRVASASCVLNKW